MDTLFPKATVNGTSGSSPGLGRLRPQLPVGWNSHEGLRFAAPRANTEGEVIDRGSSMRRPGTPRPSRLREAALSSHRKECSMSATPSQKRTTSRLPIGVVRDLLAVFATGCAEYVPIPAANQDAPPVISV